MRTVYMISGGITKFAKAHQDKDFRLMVKEAYDYASAGSAAFLQRHDRRSRRVVFLRPLHADNSRPRAWCRIILDSRPKPSKRVEGGGATGGLCFQSAWEAVASGRMNCCLAFGLKRCRA